MSYDCIQEFDPDLGGAYDFKEWQYRGVISKCLRQLGYSSLADFTLRPGMDTFFVLDCLKVASTEAIRLKNTDVLSQLAINGLAV